MRTEMSEKGRTYFGIALTGSSLLLYLAAGVFYVWVQLHDALMMSPWSLPYLRALSDSDAHTAVKRIIDGLLLHSYHGFLYIHVIFPVILCSTLLIHTLVGIVLLKKTKRRYFELQVALLGMLLPFLIYLAVMFLFPDHPVLSVFPLICAVCSILLGGCFAINLIRCVMHFRCLPA